MTLESSRPTWEDVRYDLIETGWFALEARPKTERAVENVVSRLSDEELELLLDRISIVFAPEPDLYGVIMPLSKLVIGDSDTGLRSIMVYLPGRLERQSQRCLDSTVAHEFAHVLLHPSNFGPHTTLTQEREADDRIRQWGFAPSYREEDYPDIRAKASSGVQRTNKQG